jgi:tRNA 2-thiouridine synthesizing protein A
MHTDLHELDMRGLKCPIPIVQLSRFMKQLPAGAEVLALTDDPAFCLDSQAWCRKTGNLLLDCRTDEDTTSSRFRKV